MPTVADLLSKRNQLQAVSDSPGLDTELLLCHCLQKPRSFLKAWPEQELSDQQLSQFLDLFARRLKGEPVAYLLGECGFWSLDLYTNAATLIPRPDTELLVEEILGLVFAQESISVLDLGTGTGAIALALASERPGWQLLACDVQPEAVQLAQKNARRLALENVSVIESDWFEQIPVQAFQVIVSNPPYIDPADPHLQEGDVRYEPRSALVAEDGGYADLAFIITQSVHYLAEGGWLLLEHGYNQAEGVRQRLQLAGYTGVYTVRDLAGHERVTVGRLIQQTQ